MGFWAAALPAVASVAGGLLSKSSSDDANETNRQISDQNIQLQKDFAQYGIRWKVADAKKAGLHPLAALGAQTHSYAPSSVGRQEPVDYSIHGQNLARSFSTMMTSLEREKLKEQLVQAKETSENMRLRNEILRSQIDQETPPMPLDDYGVISGQANTSNKQPISKYVDIVPSQQRPQSKLGLEAGIPAGTKDQWLPGKRILRTITRDLSEPMESDFIAWAKYQGSTVADYIMGLVGRPPRHSEPERMPPKGHFWDYNRVSGMWQAKPLKVLIKRHKANKRRFKRHIPNQLKKSH